MEELKRFGGYEEILETSFLTYLFSLRRPTAWTILAVYSTLIGVSSEMQLPLCPVTDAPESDTHCIPC